MAEWRPIETAPKDGSAVLLLDGDNLFVARWAVPSGKREAEWLSVACVDDFYTAMSPTHWMPLPKPPK